MPKRYEKNRFDNVDTRGSFSFNNPRLGTSLIFFSKEAMRFIFSVKVNLI